MNFIHSCTLNSVVETKTLSTSMDEYINKVVTHLYLRSVVAVAAVAGVRTGFG